MGSSHRMSAADVGDRHRRFVALAMLAVGVFYALSAAGHLVGQEAAGALKAGEIVMVAVAVAFLVPIFLWKLRARGNDEWHLYKRRDGFVADSVSRSHLASWVVTFLLLTGLSRLAHRFGDLPPEFFLQVVLAAMLGAASAVFLYLSRDPEEDGFEDLDA